MLFFLSAKCHGLDVKHPHFWQHILQLEMLIAEDQWSTLTVALARITTKDLCFESGFQGSLTNVPLCVLEHVSTKSWIQALTIFAIKAKIVLQDPHPRLQRKWHRDVFLMEHFIQRSFREVEFCQLNHCCHSVGMLHLSNMVSADGSGIPPSFHEGTHKSFWPTRTMQPPKCSLKWELWKCALNLLCDEYLCLHSPSGNGYRLPIWKTIILMTTNRLQRTSNLKPATSINR